jgi:type II secretion system protein N
MELLKGFLYWLWQQKKRFLLTLLATLVFLFLLFPFGDLSDLVTGQVSKLTQNQVFVQFQDMRISFFPETGLALDQLHLEAASLPPIKAEELVFTPSISSLIFQKPAGAIAAKGILKGEIEASLSPGKKSDNGVERQQVTIRAQRINLAELKNLANLPIPMNGTADLNADSQVDLTFQEQPEVEIALKIDKLQIPSFTAQTPIGPWPLPELSVSTVELKGRLSAGRFIIETGTVGGASDDLSGTIKGNFGFSILPQGERFIPMMGAYQIDLDLKIRRKLHDQLKTALGMLDQYQTPIEDGAALRIRLSGADTINPPSMSQLR